MKQTARPDRHREIVEQRARKSVTYARYSVARCIKLTSLFWLQRCGRMRG
jgi:hypothetical protein